MFSLYNYIRSFFISSVPKCSRCNQEIGSFPWILVEDDERDYLYHDVCFYYLGYDQSIFSENFLFLDDD